jgi:hypothetical protein
MMFDITRKNMIETDINRICKTLSVANVYTMRSLIVYFYHCQLNPSETTDNVFNAFFTLEHDAQWCRRQVDCMRQTGNVSGIMWPPLPSQPTTIVPVLNIRNRVFIPMVPTFMDQQMLSHCLSLYGV